MAIDVSGRPPQLAGALVMRRDTARKPALRSAGAAGGLLALRDGGKWEFEIPRERRKSAATPARTALDAERS